MKSRSIRLTFAGGVLIALSLLCGWLVGARGTPNAWGVDEDRFDWTNGALAFAPFFVSGVILLATASAVRAFDQGRPPPTHE